MTNPNSHRKGVICMDVAVRYESLYNGKINIYQTDVDAIKFELCNHEGKLLGEIDPFRSFKSYPEPDWNYDGEPPF